MTDNLEALFDEIVAQNASSSVEKTTTAAASPQTEPIEEDLEALFDEISEKNAAPDVAQTVTEVTLPEVDATEEDLEALFNEISEKNTTSGAPKTGTATAQTETEPSEEDLEALFNGIAEQRSTSETKTTIATEPALEKLIHQDDADKPLYDRLGGIVRQLHDSLRELGYDRALEEAVSEVNDTKGRLEYVATLTEQAATRVLNSIDIGLPQQDELLKTAKNMDQRWALLFEGSLSIDEFKQLAQDAQKFSTQAINSAEHEKARLMEIMMAQDFQDITGQIIKKVITITKRLEQELAQLLRDNAPAETKEKHVDLMSGPDVPTKAMAQDDVDSLLATLGF